MSGNEQIAVSRHSSKDPTSLFLVAQSFIPVLSKEMEKNLKQHRSDLFPFRCKHHTFVIGEESQSLCRRLLFKKRRSCSSTCRSFYHVSIHPKAISTLPCSSGPKENWSCATTTTRVNRTTLRALKSHPVPAQSCPFLQSPPSSVRTATHHLRKHDSSSVVGAGRR